MGDFEKSEFYGLWSEFLNVPKTIKLNPTVISGEISRLMFERIAEKSLPHRVFMKGDFESRFDYIIDVINDARLKGLTPIEINIKEDVQIPNPYFDEFTKTHTLRNLREYTITIKLKEEND